MATAPPHDIHSTYSSTYVLITGYPQEHVRETSILAPFVEPARPTSNLNVQYAAFFQTPKYAAMRTTHPPPQKRLERRKTVHTVAGYTQSSNQQNLATVGRYDNMT